MKTSLGMVMFLSLSPLLATADVVVPVDSVESYVNVRMRADADSAVVGRLHQGESMLFVQTESGWHEIALEGGGGGFIHEDWAVVVASAGNSGEANESVGELADVDDAVESADPASADDAPADAIDVSTAVVAETETEIETGIAEPDVPAADGESLADIGEIPTTEISSSSDESAGESGVSEQLVAQPVADVDEPTADEVQLAETTEALADESLSTIVPVLVGPSGPGGPAGPPGPAGAATVEGSVDYLMKFTGATVGGNSQIFDNGRNIGIGTDSPKQRLEVNGNIQIHEQNSNVAGIMLTQSSGETGYIMHNRASTLTIGAGSVDRITIDRDGNVGIGMSRPSHPIELASGAHVTAGGAWTNSSSIERKENISELTPEEALRALADLEPVHFNYKQDAVERYVGFIAEDVPELVATTDRKGLSTMDIVAVLTKVVQMQQKQIEELEKRLTE